MKSVMNCICCDFFVYVVTKKYFTIEFGRVTIMMSKYEKALC